MQDRVQAADARVDGLLGQVDLRLELAGGTASGPRWSRTDFIRS
jgi:hypothetical protein